MILMQFIAQTINQKIMVRLINNENNLLVAALISGNLELHFK